MIRIPVQFGEYYSNHWSYKAKSL